MSTREDLGRTLGQVGAPLRGFQGMLWLLRALALALLLLGVVAWWARVSQHELVMLVLVTWVLVLGVLLTGWVLARRAMRAIGASWIAGELEAHGDWRRGSLTTVLDHAAEGTSPSLQTMALNARVAEVKARGADALHPAVAQLKKTGRYTLAAVAGSLVILLAARPLQGTPARLWNPLAAWTALTAPVRLVPRTPSVARGESGTLHLIATGHRSATLLTRMPGEAWKETVVTLDDHGEGDFTTAPLAAELIARLEAGGRSSDEVRITIRLPAFLGSFVVTARYPAYLGLEPETLPLGGDTLMLPQGTRLDLVGRATVPLGSAQVAGPAGSTALEVDGVAFHGALTPTQSGRWRLNLRPATGDSLDGDAPTLTIQMISDSVPVVDIPVPGVDTLVGPTLQFSLLIAVHDDHGLDGALVEMRRGASSAITRMPLDLGSEHPDRALLSASIDLSTLGMRPGDTLHYVAVATDNSPGHQRGRSREFWIRIPTEAELTLAREEAARATGKGLDSLAASAARLQRQTDDLAKERPRADPAGQGNGDNPEPMSADAARKAEAVARAQEQLMKDAAKAQKDVDDLRQAAAKQGLADSAFVQQLDEIRKLMQMADSPELREAMAALQQALTQLDPEATRAAMQNLAEQQAQYKTAMEQARELFKRAALEGDLSNLQEKAQRLSEEQGKHTEKLSQAAAQQAEPQRSKADSASAAQAIAEERAMAQRADSLAAALDRAAQKVPSDSVRDGLQKTAEQVRQAGEQMQQAAQSAQNGKQQQAQTSAKQAEQKLKDAQKDIKEEKEQLQEEMKEEVLRALDRTLAETARLAQRQLKLIEDFQHGGALTSTRAEQSLVDDGIGRLIAQMGVISGKNAMVPQQIGIALEAARVSMRGAVDAVGSLNPNLGGASTLAGEAVDALAVAAFAMLRAKDRVGDSQSGSGMEEAMKEMQEAAQQQGKAAKEAGQKMQSGETGPQQLMQMAMQQRAIANQLERMRASGNSPGAGSMAKEAKEIAREIESGQLDKLTVDRQEKLYKKMLDAGRQLQGEEDEDEKERKSTTAKDGNVKPPAALDPRLRIGDDGIRLPGWETLQRLSPDERRRVLEYFQRLTAVKRP